MTWVRHPLVFQQIRGITRRAGPGAFLVWVAGVDHGYLYAISACVIRADPKVTQDHHDLRLRRNGDGVLPQTTPQRFPVRDMTKRICRTLTLFQPRDVTAPVRE
jgi:hypothetical protein